MTDTAILFTAGGALIALLGLVGVSHRYQSDKLAAAIEKIETAKTVALEKVEMTKDALQEKLRAIETQLRTEIGAVSDRESKQRHDLANNVQREVGAMSTALATLSREAVRRSDIEASETRRSAEFEKMGARFDLVSEKLVSLAVLEKQFASLEAKLDRVLDSRTGAD